MPSSPIDKLKQGVFISVVISIVVTAAFVVIGEPTIVLENITVFNSTVTTVLGLLFTVLAIIYTFESQFESNRAIKQLKYKGEYKNITRIFFLSVATVGIVWLYTFTLAVFQIHGLVGRTGDLILSFMSIFGYILLIERLLRCFWIFVLLNRAVKANE